MYGLLLEMVDYRSRSEKQWLVLGVFTSGFMGHFIPADGDFTTSVEVNCSKPEELKIQGSSC